MGCKGLRGERPQLRRPEHLLDVEEGSASSPPFSFLALPPPRPPPPISAKLSQKLCLGSEKGSLGAGGWGVPSLPNPPCRQVGTPSVVADRRNFKEWAVRVCHKGRVCELSGIRPLMSLQLSSPN